MKQLRVTRPDGTLIYDAFLDDHHTPIHLGALFVKDGRIVLQCDVDGDTGSVVRPGESWVGDMAFSVTERRNDGE